MKNIFAIIFLLFFSLAKSQTPNWVWGKSAPSSPLGWGEGWDVATDDSENVFFTGTFSDTITFGNDTLISPTYTMFLAKYDSSGNVLWARCPTGPGYVFTNAVTVDNLGNCYVTGQYYSNPIYFGNDTLNNSGIEDIFIVKYDPNGNVVWAKGLGGINDDIGLGVTTDFSGNCYVTGYFFSPSLIFGSDTLISYGNINTFLFKYDPLGNAIWAKQGIAPSANGGNGVTIDPSGNIYLTGYFGGPKIYFGSDSLMTSGVATFYLVKYDPNGNVIWCRNSVGVGDAQGTDVATDAFGNSYTTGYFDSLSVTFGATTVSTTTSGNFFLVKYDANGNALWAKSCSGNNMTQSFNVAVDSCGYSFVSGEIYNTAPISFGTINLVPPINSVDPMFIVEYNPNGNSVFGEILISGGDDDNSVALGKSGSVYIAGDFIANPFIFNSDTLIPYGDEDAFVARLNNTASCNNPETIFETNEFSSFEIFPNPASEQFNIFLPDNVESAIMEIYTAQGKLIEQKTIRKKEVIDVSTYAKGMYFVRVNGEAKRIIVE